jgi:hypothetical protein
VSPITQHLLTSELRPKKLRESLALTTMTLVLWATGCSSLSRPDRAAEATNLDVTIQGIGVQPRGGLPDHVRLTVKNTFTGPLLFTLPRPLVDEQTVNRSIGPLVLLGLLLKDSAAHEEIAIYARPEAKPQVEPTTVTLGAGGTWVAEYPLTDFYFWGPCGPDTGGSFTRYFSKGDKAVELKAILIWEKTDCRIESKAIGLHVEHEKWLLTNKRDL